MAWSITANTNDFQWSPQSHTGGGDQTILVMGWFHPNSLAANASLFQAADGSGIGVRAGATNSARVEIVNKQTTPNVYTSSTDILANSRWHFIAALYTAETTTDTAQAALWYTIGFENQPIEDTLTLTQAGVGNITTTTGALFVGSAATASTAGLIGDFGQVAVFQFGTAGATNIIEMLTVGVISQATKDEVFQSYVLPFWRGSIAPSRLPGGRGTGSALRPSYLYESYDCSAGISPQGGGGLVKRGLTITNAAPSIITTASATSSTLVRQPRAYLNNHDPLLRWVRR